MSFIQKYLPFTKLFAWGKKKSFFRDVFALTSGTSLGQAITIISLPLLARLYGPSPFGLLAIFISISGIGTVVSSLRYEMAIVLPEKREEGANLLVGTFGITTIVSIIIGLTLWPFRFQITNFLKSPDLLPYFWLIPVSILFSGFFQAVSYWCSREGLYKELSISKVLNAAITVSLQIAAFYLGYANESGLIASVVIGSAISSIIIIIRLFAFDKSFWCCIRLSSIFSILARYKKFPIYDNWAALLNSISWQLPNFFLSIFFTSVEVGFYSIGNRLLRLPMSLIGNSIGQVFFQRAAEAERSGNLKGLVTQVYSQLVKIGLFPMLVLAIVGREVFEIGLGKEWAEGGIYTQILSLWMFFWFISSPLSTIFRVLEKQEFSLGINILIFVTRITSLYIGGVYGSIYLALSLFSLTGILLYGYLSLAIVHAAGVSYRFIFQTLFHELLSFLPVGLLLILFKVVIPISSLGITILSVLILTVYFLYFLRKVSQRMLEIQEPTVTP